MFALRGKRNHRMPSLRDMAAPRRCHLLSAFAVEARGLAKILNVFESEHFRLPRRSMKVLRETAVSLAFDGGNNVGMLALFHAAQATIKKTAAHGIALV